MVLRIQPRRAYNSWPDLEDSEGLQDGIKPAHWGGTEARRVLLFPEELRPAEWVCTDTAQQAIATRASRHTCPNSHTEHGTGQML